MKITLKGSTEELLTFVLEVCGQQTDDNVPLMNILDRTANKACGSFNKAD